MTVICTWSSWATFKLSWTHSFTTLQPIQMHKHIYRHFHKINVACYQAVIFGFDYWCLISRVARLIYRSYVHENCHWNILGTVQVIITMHTGSWCYHRVYWCGWPDCCKEGSGVTRSHPSASQQCWSYSASALLGCHPRSIWPVIEHHAVLPVC